MNFFQVSEGLKDQQIDSTFGQNPHLLPKGVACLLERSFAQGFNSGSQRANRSCDPNIEAFGGITSQANACAVDVVGLIRHAVSSESEGITPESIGFNDFGAGLQVFVVNSTDQVRLGKVELVIRTVDKDALGVEQRPH